MSSDPQPTRTPATAPVVGTGVPAEPVFETLSGRHANHLLVTYVATASILLHVLLLPLWVLWLDRRTVHESPAVKGACAELTQQQALVERECRDPVLCEVEKPLELALLEETTPPEPEPPLAEEDVEAYVVTPPDVTETDPPPDDVEAFGATVDTRAEEQMVAKGDHYGLDSGAAAPRQELAAPARPRQAVEVPRPRAQPSPERASARPAPELEPPEVESQDGENKQGQDEEEAVMLSPSEEAPSLDALLPNFEEERLAAVAAPIGGGTVDYLKDVDEGDRTLLNRKRVSYADFFERVKLGVATHWNPAGVYRQRDPSGRVYGVEDRLTVLNVTLRGDGTLAQLYVERPSGLDFLDDEAVRAMNAAVPFPNPPEGLKDLDGLVHFRFAFQFEISTRRFRLFRYR